MDMSLGELYVQLFVMLVVVVSKIVMMMGIIFGIGFVIFTITRKCYQHIENDLVIIGIIIVEIIILIPAGLTLLIGVMRSLVL